MMNRNKWMPILKNKMTVACTGGMAVLAASGLVVYETAKAEVQIDNNGETHTYRTHVKTVAELLEEADIKVGAHDAVSHHLNAALQDGMKISYDQAKQLKVRINGKEQVYHTTADHVGAFLKEAEIKVNAHDEMSVKKTKVIQDGLEVDIKKAYQVKINDGGKERTAWTTGTTIEQLLEDYGIEVGELDEVKPGLKERTAKGTAVNITKVEKKNVEEAVGLPVETIVQNDPALDKGTERVIQEGENGKQIKRYEVTLKNGKETSRKLQDVQVADAGKKRIIVRGTKQPVQSATAASSSTGAGTQAVQTARKQQDQPSSGREITVSATAYTADCNGCSGYTATGMNLNTNRNAKVIAVDPNVIPLGTKVWVEGYGYAIAGDTGGAINGNRIDLHMPTTQAAKQFGRQQLKVRVVN